MRARAGRATGGRRAGVGQLALASSRGTRARADGSARHVLAAVVQPRPVAQLEQRSAR